MTFKRCVPCCLSEERTSHVLAGMNGSLKLHEEQVVSYNVRIM